MAVHREEIYLRIKREERLKKTGTTEENENESGFDYDDDFIDDSYGNR